jgi:hypothetical protein
MLFDAETHTNTAMTGQNCSDIIAKGARLLASSVQPVREPRPRPQRRVPRTKTTLQAVDHIVSSHEANPINNASTWLELENSLRKAQGKGAVVMKRAPRGATDIFGMAM